MKILKSVTKILQIAGSLCKTTEDDDQSEIYRSVGLNNILIIVIY